jgi:hypothetical protein
MPHIQIADLTPRVDYTVGVTPQTAFTVPFPFFANSDLDVYVGGELQTLTTDYTVTGAGTSEGGTVTLVTAVTSTAVAIVRDLPIERTSDFPASGPLQTDSLNTDLDKIVAMMQQLETGLSRAVRLPDDEPTTDQRLPSIEDRANKFLAFDADGDLIASSGSLDDSIPVSSFVEGALGASDIAEFFEEMGWRWLDANATVFVRADATGDTGRDGSADTTASAFLTWQAAYNYVRDNFYFNNKSVTIRMGNASVLQTFEAAGILLSINGWSGGGTLNIIGNTSTPANAELESTAGDCIRLTGNLKGEVTINGFTITVITSGYGINNESTGHVTVGANMIYSDAVGGHLAVTWKAATMHVQAGYTIAGDATLHIEADAGLMQINSGTTIISGSRSFGSFVRVRNHGSLICLNAYSTNVASGVRFQVNENGFCNVETNDLTFFPGNSPGIAQTGGVYSGAVLLQGLTSATAAEMEAASSALVPVTPSVQQRHPGHPKAWGLITYSGGTPQLAAGYNVSASVTDTGVGIARVTFTTAFSSTSYGVLATNQQEFSARGQAISTTVAEIRVADAAGTPGDYNFCFAAYGDQA